MTKIFILLVEDEADMRELVTYWLKSILEDTDKVDTAENIEQARALLARQAYDIIFLDLNLKDSKGLDTLDEIKSICQSKSDIVLLTGMSIPENDWRKLGVAGYLEKISLTKEKVKEKVRAYLKIKSFSKAVDRAERALAALQFS